VSTAPGGRFAEPFHISRHFAGPGDLEAGCPCRKEVCGFVNSDDPAPECTEHNALRHGAKSIRSGHRAVDCPGAELP
jgi:hypothetical protein